jgi:hypothetical protein
MFGDDDLDGWLRELRGGLAAAVITPGHPWRTPVLGTTENNNCRLRTVVLRQATAKLSLWFYTDARSTKVRHIRRHPHVEWLF